MLFGLTWDYDYFPVLIAIAPHLTSPGFLPLDPTRTLIPSPHDRTTEPGRTLVAGRSYNMRRPENRASA